MHKIQKSRRILIKIIIIFASLINSLVILIGKKSIIIKKKLSLKKSSKTKVAMCAIAKTENRYIKYFLEFYKNLGYDHIYIYDNNDIDEAPISSLPLAKQLINEGYLSVIDYKKRTGNLVTESFHICYKDFNSQYDWISFYDIDEYLMLEPKNLSIQDCLDSPQFNNCESVQFNWRLFTDNEQLDFEDKSPVERFPVETNYIYENRNVKSTIRGGLNKIKETDSPHTIYENLKACSSSGKPTNNKYELWPPDFAFGALNHYRTKTVKEYFRKMVKTKKEVDNVDKLELLTTMAYFNYFFMVNKMTREKVNIFNQLFHTNYQ